MPLRVIAFLFILLLPVICRANSYTYNYDANCCKAYQSFLSLHLEEGHNYIAEENRADPNNLMATYVADYEDCIELLMNCDKNEYDHRKNHFDERLEVLDKGDRSSPWYRFCKAGVYVHRAIVNIRFGEQYSAAMNFHRSFALLEENEQLFPDFEYNHVFTGLEEAVIGSLPGSYKWIASMFGMKGDVKRGTAQLAAFVSSHNSTQPIYAETVLYYSFARFYLLAEQKEVWDVVNSPQFSTHDNLLNTFVKVNIALDYRRSDAAIQTLKDAITNTDYDKYPIFDYQMGVALLTRMDTNCTYYFHQYLKKNKSDIYIKDAWQKIGFAWYANNNTAKAAYCIEQVRTKGTTRLDADKQANRFAENKVWPLRELLQARLLIDGGYNDVALKILKGIDPTTLKQPADKAEYFFRTGRVYEELFNNTGDKKYFQSALDNYGGAISTGKERHEQFAARAALQTGKMYEHTSMKKEALAKYNECLNMPSHDFQNSIDQQAKSGVNRVGEK